MSALPYFDAEAIVAAVPMPAAVEVLREAFRDLGDLHPRRGVSLGPSDDLLMMPAVAPAGIGIKIVTVVSGNPARGLPLIHGHYLFCDRETGVPLATLDGSALTALRTPAASALATDVLARPDVRTLGIFGTGVQARGHVEAVLAVRPGIESIAVCGRTPESGEAFAAGVEAGRRTVVAATATEAAACHVGRRAGRPHRRSPARHPRQPGGLLLDRPPRGRRRPRCRRIGVRRRPRGRRRGVG